MITKSNPTIKTINCIYLTGEFMKHNIIIFLLLLNILLLTSIINFSVNAKATNNNEKKLEAKNHDCKILIYYPETIYPKLNKTISSKVDYYLKNFKKNAKNSPIPESFQFTLYIFYETYTYKDYLSYVFRIEEFTGRAHPNHELFTINYNIKENKFITIKDLKDKDPHILEELSKTSRTMLKENKNINSLSMLYEGTTPTIENFSNFVFTKKGLTFFFPQYQVAPYSEGEFNITVPYKKSL